MPLTHIRIENFRSIKRCDILPDDLTALIGANGTGKTNILSAVAYFYNNLTENNYDEDIFDLNNKFSDQVKITLTFDISNFVIIARKNRYERFDMLDGKDDDEDDVNYIAYFRSIMRLYSRNGSSNIFRLQMSQVKGQGIRWSEPYENRVIIKGLFPFFRIDTRSLDINEWTEAWNVLAELAKMSKPEQEKIEARIRDIVNKDKELKNKVKAVEDVFDRSGLNVVHATAKDYAKMLSKVYFSGERIEQYGRKLLYYSTGTNSSKYIELLLYAISEIGHSKMKEPVVLIDEPEIGFHSNNIDGISETLLSADNKFRALISTHSARLVKNLMSAERIVLYNVRIRGKYTGVSVMNKYQVYSPSSKYRVLDDYINSYFSRCLLFVEGETELELFSDPYLRELFPRLKKIDIYKAMSQEPILNIMDPRKTGSRVPYICLIDMDKVLNFDPETGLLIQKPEFFKTPKEKFRYRSRKETDDYLYHTHKRISSMTGGLRLHCYRPFYSCNDPNYAALTETVHNYLLNYGVYTFRTTTEGALINERNIPLALEFLKLRSRKKDYEEFEAFLGKFKETDRINILRLVYEGKSDLWQDYDKEMKKRLDGDDALTIERVKRFKKASGWETEYIDFFFSKQISGEDKSPRGMKKMLGENADSRNYLISKFESQFPELYDLIKRLEHLTG